MLLTRTWIERDNGVTKRMLQFVNETKEATGTLRRWDRSLALDTRLSRGGNRHRIF